MSGMGCACAGGLQQAAAGFGATDAAKPWYTYVTVGALAGGITGVVFPDPFTRFFDFKKKETFDRVSVMLAGVGGAVGLLVWLSKQGGPSA